MQTLGSNKPYILHIVLGRIVHLAKLLLGACQPLPHPPYSLNAEVRRCGARLSHAGRCAKRSCCRTFWDRPSRCAVGSRTNKATGATRFLLLRIQRCTRLHAQPMRGCSTCPRVVAYVDCWACSRNVVPTMSSFVRLGASDNHQLHWMKPDYVGVAYG